MLNNEVTNYSVLKEAGAIFATAVTTDYLELNNYQIVDFIVITGIGTAANTTIKVQAKLGSAGSAADISFKEKTGATEYVDIASTGKTFSIGGTEGECGFIVIRVDADKLKGSYDRVALNIAAVTDSTVPGSIVALVQSPRYSK